MKLVTYGLGLMFLGVLAGVLVQLWIGMAVLAIGTGLLLVALIEMVDADISRRQEEIDSRADDVRSQHTLF